jgi:Asp/Glu/hydantoin racemase
LAESIAVVHTSPATIEIFRQLLREQLPGRQIINILDDSILPELRDNGGDLSAVLPRWRDYARIAKERGAALILNACSSIGSFSAPVSAELGIPIVRVDARMARQAVMRGRNVAVAATLRTTLGPTCEMVKEAASATGESVHVEEVLVEGAYEALMHGDPNRHDELLTAALRRVAATADVVVLAQASMARVLAGLSEADRRKFLSSPPLAVRDIVELYQRPLSLTGEGPFARAD